LDELGPEKRVCAWHHDDRVVGQRVDDNAPDTGCDIYTPQKPGIDRFRAQEGVQRFSEGILPHQRHKCRMRTKPCRGHGLIRTLAARESLEAVAEHGLAGARMAWRPHDKVHVHAACDDHPPHRTFDVHARTSLEAGMLT
jgi:hypothetical protein